MLMSPMRDGRTTSEDSATQLLICEPLSFAIYHIYENGEENISPSDMMKNEEFSCPLIESFPSSSYLKMKGNLLCNPISKCS